EERRRGVDALHSGEHLRREAHALEGGAVLAQRDLVLGRAVEEIEYRARQAPLCKRAQVADVPGAPHPPTRAPRRRAGGLRLRRDPGDIADRVHSALTPEALITRAQRS